MIRRFETYAFVPGTTDEAKARLGRVLLDCHIHIPEVVHNAIGWNRSASPVELVWEHAYESADAYRRYMVHPYHAEMLDRYILVDSPERVVEPLSGAGLFGYHCHGPSFALTGGARRVVLARLEAGHSVDGILDAQLTEATKQVGGSVSVTGVNTLANSWFDGETPLSERPPKWTMVWEQGFTDLEALAAGVGQGEPGPPVTAWTDLRYEVVTA